MRLVHPPLVAALLAAALAAPLPAQVTGRAQPRAQAPGNGNTIIVWPRTLQTLQTRLDSFAAELSAAERALWSSVLLRAAHAPAPAAGEVRLAPVVQIGPGGGCDDAQGADDATGRVAIIVQGGPTGPSNRIIVQGGRTAGQSGIAAQGGLAPAAGAPRPTPAGSGAVAIGPKQDDPAPPPQSLGRRLVSLSQTLSAEERGALDWLLNRAASAPPVALPPGPCNPETGCHAPGGGAQGGVSLRQALGIDPLAIGPKQDDPTPAPPSTRWMLRY